MKEIVHGPELTSQFSAPTLNDGVLFVMPDGPSHEAMKGSETPPKKHEAVSPGAESLNSREKIKGALGRVFNKTIFRAKDEVKKDEVRDSLSDEAAREETVPDSGTGMPEEIIEAEEVRPTGSATGGAGEDASGTASDHEDTVGAGDMREPEAAAGGAGGGDEPPRGRGGGAGFEDEGEDDGGRREAPKGRRERKIDAKEFKDPEVKKLAEQINELEEKGILNPEVLKKMESKILDKYLEEGLGKDYKSEAEKLIKSIRDKEKQLLRKKENEEAGRKITAETLPDLDLLRNAGELGDIARQIEYLWDDAHKELRSGTVDKEKLEAKIKKLSQELNGRTFGSSTISDEENPRILRSDDPKMSGEERSRLIEDFNITQSLLGHELMKINRKFVTGEVRKEGKEGEKDVFAETIMSLALSHEQLGKLFEWSRDKGSLDDLDVDILDEILDPREKGAYSEFSTEKKYKEGSYESIKDYLYTKIEEDIDGIRLDAGSIYRSNIVNEIANMSLNPEAKDRGYEYYGMALEYAVERIIGLGDVNPLGEYPQLNLQQQQNLDDLIQSSRVLDENFYRYLVNLKGKRQISHALFKNLKDARAFMELVTRSLDTGGFKFIEDEVGGISWMQNAYEQELGWRTAYNGFTEKGWLLFSDYKEADESVRKRAENAGERGLLKKKVVPYEEGKDFGKEVVKELGEERVDEVKNEREMRPWEVQRAFLMGRSMNAATQRRLVYTVMGDVNENVPVEDFIRSLESEFVTNRLSPIKLVAHRYFGGMSGGRRIYAHAMDRIKQRGIDGQKEKIYGFSKSLGGQEQTYAPYGYSWESNAALDTGIVDPKSSGWRARPLFLDQEEYARYSLPEDLHFEAFENDKVTLLDYINVLKRNTHAGGHGHEGEHGKVEFNRIIRPILEKERLSLGVLLKHIDVIDHDNKVLLWSKASDLLPSRIASILPHDTVDIIRDVYGLRPDDEKKNADTHDKTPYNSLALEKWEQIRGKLYLAEQMRVDEDGVKLRVKRDKDSKEVVDVPVWEGKALSEYLEKIGINDEKELEVIRRLQALGKSRANELAKMHFPFTPFLDDVPRTAWDNLGRTDLDRILVNDQTDMQEGYGQIVGLIGNPAQGLGKAEGIFHEAVEKIKSPTSLEEAQHYVEPWIFSYLVMAAKKPQDIATFGIRRLWRGATSEMQEFNKSTDISYEPEVLASFISGLAAHEILADDPAEVEHGTKFEGKTQYERLRKELGLSLRDISLWQLHFLLLILAAAMTEKTIKEAIPSAH